VQVVTQNAKPLPQGTLVVWALRKTIELEQSELRISQIILIFVTSQPPLDWLPMPPPLLPH